MNKFPFILIIYFSIFNNLEAIVNFDWYQYYAELVDSHNAIRAKHGLPALTIDKNLEKYAQETAYNSLFSGTFKNGQVYRNGEYLGQNLYIGIGNPHTGKYLTDYWYSENAYYNYYNGKSQNGAPINHFAQIVWKSTEKIGCGISVGLWKDYKESYYICCYYSPGGNLPGVYVQNIPRPIY